MLSDQGACQVTAGQRLLWLLQRHRGAPGTMAVPLLLQVNGPLDPARVQAALGRLVARHESLRTVFTYERRALRARVSSPGPDLPRLAVVPTSGVVSEAELLKVLLQPQDLSVSPFNATLWQGSDQHLLAVNLHHLVTDAWSNRLLARDLVWYYNSVTDPDLSPLPAIGWQFSQFAAWQNEALEQPELCQYREELAAYLYRAPLPELPPRPPQRSQRSVFERGGVRPASASHDLALAPGTLRQLQDSAARLRCTVFMLLLAGFAKALAEQLHQPELTTSSIFANRTRAEVAQTCGFFANLLPLRLTSGGGSLANAVASTRSSVLKALRWQELPHLTLPFDRIGLQGEGRPEDVVFHLLAQPPGVAEESLHFAGTETALLPLPAGLGSRFDLEVLISPGPDLGGVVRYAPDRLSSEFIDELSQRFLAELSRGQG